MLLDRARPCARTCLRAAVRPSWTHHDALRLRFRRTPRRLGAGVRRVGAGRRDAALAAAPSTSPTSPRSASGAALEALAGEAQASLDLARARSLRAAALHWARGGPSGCCWSSTTWWWTASPGASCWRTCRRLPPAASRAGAAPAAQDHLVPHLGRAPGGARRSGRCAGRAGLLGVPGPASAVPPPAGRRRPTRRANVEGTAPGGGGLADAGGDAGAAAGGAPGTYRSQGQGRCS